MEFPRSPAMPEVVTTQHFRYMHCADINCSMIAAGMGGSTGYESYCNSVTRALHIPRALCAASDVIVSRPAKIALQITIPVGKTQKQARLTSLDSLPRELRAHFKNIYKLAFIGV
jgi:hypothetical protein